MRAGMLNLYSSVLLAWLACRPRSLAGSVFSESTIPNVAFETSQETLENAVDISSNSSSGSSSQGYQIVTFDWLAVHVPYLITFWILVAASSLIESGEKHCIIYKDVALNKLYQATHYKHSEDA